MQNADKKRVAPEMPDRTGLPTRYSVEVFIRTPFEGTSQYRATYTAPPFALEDAPAGVPSGPGSVSPAPPTGQAPFYGETTSRALFPPYPAAAIEAANADREMPPAPLLEAPRAPASFWQGGLAPPTAPRPPGHARAARAPTAGRRAGPPTRATLLPRSSRRASPRPPGAARRRRSTRRRRSACRSWGGPRPRNTTAPRPPPRTTLSGCRPPP
jgi:hypothetical protein